jgi:hypothetical protein
VLVGERGEEGEEVVVWLGGHCRLGWSGLVVGMDVW